jgi:hypothetical protein
LRIAAIWVCSVGDKFRFENGEVDDETPAAFFEEPVVVALDVCDVKSDSNRPIGVRALPRLMH